MIHEGDVDLDPEYQRGRSFTFMPRSSLTSAYSRGMVIVQADGHYRLTVP